MITSDQPIECCQGGGDSSLSAGAARQLIKQKIRPISAVQATPLRSALGRILAKPITSPIDVPAFRNSAMDGYALHRSDLPNSGESILKVVGSAFAGQPYSGALGPNQCIRIMTGAMMPEGADTVVMQERAQRQGEQVVIDGSTQPGANVRQAGEDISQDSEVLTTGTRIGPAELGLLASLGIAEVSTYRPVRVAFFSSGDEIKSIGQPLQEGEIYDSNRYTLFGMLTALGADVIDMGVIPDRYDAISGAMLNAANEADMVLTSGGVSVGEADFIAEAIHKLGTVHFSKVAIKPGRPLTFAHLQGTPFFGLPGNPVAVMITFMQFVRPALLQIQGANESHMPTIQARCTSALRKLAGRTEYQRGILELNGAGEQIVRSSGRQGSGVLSSMSRANCFIVLSDETTHVEPGNLVEVQPFRLFDA